MKKIKFLLILIVFAIILTGCGKNSSESNSWLVDSVAPTSSTKGKNGDMYLDNSTYDLYQMIDSEWIKIGNIAGKDGKDGKNGVDGINGISGSTPTISISKDGYWVINGKKTNVKAEGYNGQNGVDGKNGTDGKDGKNGTDGKDGKNGTDGKDGINGIDGQTPTITISEDGYWIINGKKTDVKADCKNCIRLYEENENIEIPDLNNYTLTPVVYKGNNWVVADVTKKWYDYSNQEWANAVLLNKNVMKDTGDVVTVEGDNPDALAMFVWIPRYEYKIEGEFGTHTDGTIGTKQLPGEIKVNFIPEYKKTSTEDYIIHPAFNFGGKELSGIWVGKFELSHSDSSKSTESMNCTNENCSEGNNLRVLPNVKSLRYNNVSSLFYGIKSMSKNNNTFGISKEMTDVHMIKNSEWGAVAYLSQSKYGKYGNSDYAGVEKEIYTNNSNSYYTGRSGGNSNVAATTEGSYQYNVNLSGTGASTTGNIYGVYDMNGGSYEYVMGVFSNSDGVLWSGASEESNSGFKGKVGNSSIDIAGTEWPDSKYINVYKASDGIEISSKTQCNGGLCYGHAIRETSNWYSDYLLSIKANNPWFLRGGHYSEKSYAGIFYANGSTGTGTANSTRVVLVSNK